MKKTTKLILVLTLVVIFALAMLAFAACKQPETPNPSGNGGTSQGGNTNQGENNNPNQGGNDNPNQGNDNPTKPTVTVNSNGGTVNGDFTVNNDGTLTPPTTQPTKAGYVFDGYFKDAECTIAWNFETDKVTVDITVTIYIRWKPQGGDTPITKPTVTINTNGGTFDSNITVNEDNTITEPSTIPTKPNYKFDGWYKDEDCTIKWNFETDTVTVNITIYIKWIRVYDVSFNTNNGSAISPIEADENTTISKPTDPTRDGYTFDGWYKDSDFAIPWNFTTDVVTSDTTLYAKWNKIIVATEGLAYTLNDDGESYSVSGIGTATETDIVIPSIYEGKPVTAIEENAFANCDNLTGVIIPDNVITIGRGAFSGCSSLTSITIPFIGAIQGAVQYDETAVFGYIFGYRITTSYDDTTSGVFQYSEYGNGITYNYYYNIPLSLRDVIITRGNIVPKAFYNCSNLTSVTIPNSVTEIGYSAFSGCSNLTSVTIGNGVTTIGSGVFYDCSSLQFNEYNNALYLGNDENRYVVLVKANSETITSCKINDNTKVINDAFYKCSSLTSVTIPDSVTSIGDDAFYKCSSLTSVTIGNSVKSIGNSAFSDCSSLTSITIPDSVTSIGNYAFSDCSSLTSITIPDSVTTIGAFAFYNCSSLETVYWNATACKDAGSYSYNKDRTIFKGCSNLTTVVIGDYVTTIPNYAFYNCSNLTNITIGNSVTSIGYDAFYNCSSLASVYYTGDVAGWCNISFNRWHANPLEYAHNLYIDNELVTQLVIPNTVTDIKPYAFYNCSSLTSITIPDSITSIGESAFYGCSSLTTVHWNATACTSANSIFNGCSNLTTVVIGDEVTTIPDNAFSDCSNLTNVTIGNSVTSIGYHAFDDCSNLTSVYYTGDIANWCGISGLNNIMSSSRTLYINNEQLTGELVIPDTVTEIKSHAFYCCASITSVTIGNSVTSIGQDAFYNCSNLTSVTIGDSVISIGYFGFSYCSSLETVYWNATACKDAGSYWGNNNDLTIFKGCSNLTTVVIGDNVTAIPSYVFSGCSGLTSVAIPNSITSIGESAFYGCSSLTTVHWNATACTSANSIFNGCSNLTTVVIGDNVTAIPSYVFSGCSGLTSVTIGNSVLSIGSYAFSNCSNLTNITISNSVTKIGNYAFFGCSGLINIEISNSVTTIGDYAFSGCSSLTNLTIPDSVTTIGNYTFSGCSNLTNITIPNSIVSISSSAFEYCTKLKYNEYGNALYLGNEDNPYVVLVKAKSTDIATCTINDNTKIIYAVAFYGCKKITNISIPENVESIYANAFYNCGNLETVYWKATACTYAGALSDYIFNSPSKLTKVVIDDNVTIMPTYAFRDCSSLTSVYYNGDIESWCNITFGDIYANPLSYAHNLYIKNELVTELVIPDTITEIKSNAFIGCTSITSVTISDIVTSIGGRAFNGCSNLTEINFEGTIEQWNALYKGDYWNASVPATKVICSDGEVAL